MIKNICVVGAGTMGHGIACVFAMFGYSVNLYEASESVRGTVLDQVRSVLSFLAEENHIQEAQIEGALSNITLHSELGQATKEADFVIEAIPEELELKKTLFNKLDSICPPHTILASSTSSLSLGEITADLPESRKALSMVCHWYNPPYLIPIAELSFFGNMDESVYREVYDLHVSVGKKPVKVLKDIPGLIANRMLHAMAREVFHLIEIGAASAEDIDIALKYGPGFRCATAGILETADMGGLDVWCTAEDNMFKSLNNSTEACDLIRHMVDQGKLGVKTGEGFYSYPGDSKATAKKAFNKRLLTQLKASEGY